MVSIIKPYLIYLIHILLASSVIAAPDIIGLLNPDNLRGLLNPDNLRGVADGGSDYAKPELETKSLGTWKIDNPNAGVAAMQLQLMPNDQIVWFDTTSLGPSGLKLPEGVPCPVNPEANNQPDCYAHAIAYSWRTSKYRILTVCSICFKYILTKMPILPVIHNKMSSIPDFSKYVRPNPV